MELVVVVGHSEDETLTIIKAKLANIDVKAGIFEESVGLGMARQIVVDQASGDYIIWVDDDLTLPNDYVRKQVEFMEEHPAVGIAEGQYRISIGDSLVEALENIVAVVHLRTSISDLGRLAGTEGAIWRVKATRQAGGFDVGIKGAAEDLDAAYRVKAAGWSLCETDEVFQEACRKTWKSLWDQYFWYGQGAYYLGRKNRGLVTMYKMVPPAGFLAGVLYSLRAYRLTRRKMYFLLPIHYTYKRIAWCLGFVKARMDRYGH
jgi:glycosyltransferase involved in cell wall biosynthesis